MAVAQVVRPARYQSVYEMDIPEKGAEVVEGELILSPPPSKYHNRVAFNLEQMFCNFCATHPALDFSGDADGYLVQRNPDSFLMPDACLFTRRMSSVDPWNNFGPEIVVEILSPSNSQAEMMFKRSKFFNAGTQQFWLIDLVKQEMRIFFSDGRLMLAARDEVVRGEGIAAGLTFNLDTILAE